MSEKKKTIKAWALIYDGDEFVSAHRTYRRAKAETLVEQDKVYPCTITYKVPPTKTLR